MTKKSSERRADALREEGVHYVVDAKGEPLAVLLTLQEYEHYLDLLADEADSGDIELATRLMQARKGERSERMGFREYLRQRTEEDDEVSS